MVHKRNEKRFLKCIIKPMGFIVAPLAFALLICFLALQVANLSVGDVVGYGSVLLLNPTTTNTGNTPPELVPEGEFFAPQDKVDIADIDFPVYEQVFGELSIPSADILCPLVYGDTEKALRMGAGQYIGSTIVGYGGTTMICAHVSRHFRDLHKVQVGDLIQIRTTYGAYTYEVKHTGVYSATDESAYDLAREDENLILYTCYYEQSGLGSVRKRLFVHADYVSGPMIWDGGAVK